MHGQLHLEAYLEAWNQFIGGHPVFRACFGYQDGKPVQRLGPSDPAEGSADRSIVHTQNPSDAERWRTSWATRCSICAGAHLPHPAGAPTRTSGT